MKFRIDLKIFLFVLLFFITNQIKMYAMIMVFAIIHELGHLLAGILLGMQPDKLEINPFGVSIDFNIKRKDYMRKIKKGNLLELKKILVAFAGPFVNGIIILILCFIHISPYDKMLMIFSNWTLILFNILPIYPLDGGRIVKGILYLLKGKQKAEEYIYHISHITLILLTAIGSIGILFINNIAIFLVIIFLWVLQLREDKIYKNRKVLYEIINKEMKQTDCKNLKIPIENKINS